MRVDGAAKPAGVLGEGARAKLAFRVCRDDRSRTDARGSMPMGHHAKLRRLARPPPARARFLPNLQRQPVLVPEHLLLRMLGQTPEVFHLPLARPVHVLEEGMRAPPGV